MHPTTLPSQIPEAAALLLSCIDFISDTVLITEAEPVDLPGPRVVFVNSAFERMTGYAAAEVVGRTPRLLQGPKTDRAELRRIRTELLNWHPIRAELVNYKKNGDEFFVEMDIVPIRDTGGRWTHWVSIQRDVTARKKAEAEARTRDAQRFESLGTLSSGIAHDFNNVIAAILGNVAIAALDMQSGRMPTDSMEQIKTAALRARSVVAKILAYARGSAQMIAPFELAPIVREATDLLRAILPAGVRLDVSCPPSALWVSGDASQLCQVLLNLGVNALQALEGREGRIQFTVDVTSHAPTDASTATGRAASIHVIDTGCGMDGATQARMFEPYFTTKEDGRGTGLGLSVAWGIVAAHRGTLKVASEVGQGTRITLSLPLIPDKTAEPPPPGEALPTAAAFGNGEHVLVVDDDEVVVVMLEGMLKRWGFRVTTLHDPLKAVTLVKALPDEFDLVLTDLNMPHVSGLQLAREVLAIRRDMPILLGSGTVSESLVAAALEAGIAAVFPKEFAVEQLATLMKTTLARPALSAGSTIDPPKAAKPHRESGMHEFLTNNRDELIGRCMSKVVQRSRREATNVQLANGVPLLLDQLIRTLSAEESGENTEGLLISGPAGGDWATRSEIGVAASAHGRQLLELGYSVDQVVHDYGDLCQAITDLAVERDAPFSIDSYRTLNRCLDNAIANAVTEFAAQRDAVIEAAHAAGENQRLGFLAHELRNYLNVAVLAFNALETGRLSFAGSTGAVLKRNLQQLDGLIGQTLSDVREAAHSAARQTFPLAPFIADAASLASLYAHETGCTLQVAAVDPRWALRGDREPLLAALSNLLQNAFKFTHPNTEVRLDAQAAQGRVLITVSDHCGGLPAGTAEHLFKPFTQAKRDSRGLGLGLSIAAKSVAAHGGRLQVRDIPGVGCVFTMDLPAEPAGDGDGV